MRKSQILRSILVGFCLSSCLWVTPVFALPTGEWQGTIQIPGQALEVVVHLRQNAEGVWQGSIDIPAQNSKNLPLSAIVLDKQKMRFSIAGIPGNPSFDGELNPEESELKGQFSQGGQTFAFALKRPNAEAQLQAAAKEEALIDSLREKIEQRRKEWKTPGLGVALVKGDRVLIAEGFGQRNLEKKLPVGPDTLFAIGSCTKAFTASLLGILVDQGKLDWDAPIQTYLPDFRLKQSFASEHLTTRDLLTHRSGLPRHDLVWYGAELDREALYQRLKYLDFTADFRNQFQYQNLMYMTAGYLAEKLGAHSWEEQIQTELFEPLGMKRSLTSLSAFQQEPDHALPYAKRQNQIKRIPYRSLAGAAPAGAIHSSARDMAQWLIFNLGKGNWQEKPLLSESSLKELHSPQVIMNSHASYPEIPYTLYGMGWMIHPYRGHQMISHGGNIDGYSALVSLLPEKKIGLVILSNQEHDPLPSLLSMELSDLLLELEPLDWSARIKPGMEMAEKIVKGQDLRTRVPNTHPSHPLQDYLGTYHHPAYGELKLESQAGKLRLGYRDLGGKIEHWHYDTFVVKEPDAILDKLWVHFLNNLEGDIQSVELKLDNLAEAIRFERQAPPEMLNPAFLKRYQGAFDLAGIRVEISLKGEHLQVRASGQPAFVLEAVKRDLFKLKDLEGYQVRFEFQAERLKRVIFVQPNGSFEAKPLKP
ncbi:hypothetical protein COW36_07490 [bacterium (Candidatus Blackallbacteria) CG17_big_fil_post_rev_8_21_14_2_50_48_46]|uniref:Serine hydrolase n=1 Tax=bacterium (Candidatus Blackallbacteria) CG17_big_fil_post_rev_8_21_14_2_50_48_46 TaxID=2014261 RepID=A0A2M7G707_9BACT|nr:MAG: hypothetical protein COW64_16590 [bacterium (Candidatus Blackallbacteria) CG18_big_fil_WC_8_21_14_2_50_49_26]PIW17779.1 MAG: hypothetical protein COW36_07490 [bacterium (Candidatus Blackallbacteria) CG17_big_fil_post_rev_8_21_14_2_50_48_46]PIW47338.1 MAG: hypothetical protein COW20_13015 [bacterium (Candidatus Blackallbacteria) CG13_big_fil_rev_8_21_14_2_50_49_14]